MKIIKILIMLLAWQISQAKTVELLTSIEDVGLFRVKGKFVTDKNETIQLVGISRVSKIPNSKDKIIRIMWTEVAKKSKGEPKYFTTPVMMTLAAPKVTKGTKLKFNADEIKVALKNLKKTKSKIKVKDKYSTDRKVLVPINSDDSVISQDSSNTIDSATPIHDSVNGDSKSRYGLPDDRGHMSRGAIGSGSDRQRGSMNDGYRHAYREGHHTTNGNDNLAKANLELPKLETPALSGSELDKNSSTSKRPSVEKEDDTRVEITCVDCPVRIDYDNDRVIVQNKAITYKNNEIQSQTKCTDSLEHYLIKKDYLCENCQDVIDLNAMTACPTYEKYWTDSEGRKTVLSTQPEKDETQEFSITADGKECPPYLDLENLLAYPQVELVYQDRVNARKVAKICHRADSAEATPIALTMKGCTHTHDFENNWSIPQKKGIFTLDGQEYVAFGCREEGRPIKHDYDVGVCTNNVNVQDRIASVMGKRYVVIAGNKIYLSDCEPIDSEQALMESVEGCENQYEHSQEEGRSYLKKRWYYLDGLNKQFVTPCIKSTEFLLHKAEITGYDHDDGNKKSKQITTVYIEPLDDERIDLYTNYINQNVEPIPYELVSTTNEPTDSFTFDGCYKLTQTNKYKTYTRPDGTELKQFVGVGTSQRSHDLCRRVTETKNVYHHTHIWIKQYGHVRCEFDLQDPDERKYIPKGRGVLSWTGNGSRQGVRANHRCARYFNVHKRTVTHFPNGTSTAGSWSNTGQMIKGNEYWAQNDWNSGILTPNVRFVR